MPRVSPDVFACSCSAAENQTLPSGVATGVGGEIKLRHIQPTLRNLSVCIGFPIAIPDKDNEALNHLGCEGGDQGVGQ